jgi:hypothetical protein
MPRTVQTVIARLFQEEELVAPLCHFSWHLIQRQHRPFLLLPTAPANPRVSLALYSAHRRRAKLWRAALPLMLDTPAAAVFHRIDLATDGRAPIIRFISEQTGLPAHLLPTPAIKFGARPNRVSRLVLLVCDLTDRPVKVVKLGLDAEGRATTDREANLLEKLPANTIGCIRLTGRLSTPTLSAFATDFFAGESPETDLGMELLFHAWINSGPLVPLASVGTWSELERQAAPAAPAEWQMLRPALVNCQIRTTLHHGDFAPWNIRAVNATHLEAFDWERGCLAGIPGWDWFHFVVQTSILARRNSVERVAAEIEELLESPRFQKYAEVTGIRPIAKPLVLAYLFHQRWFLKPRDGMSSLHELSGLLAARWGFLPPAVGGAEALVPAATAAGPRPGLWADARDQLKMAWAQLANVFWEPTLTAAVEVPILDQLRASWRVILFCAGWLMGAIVLQLDYTRHMLLLPVFAIPCLLAGWQISRGWGTVFATLSALAGPLVAVAREPTNWSVDVTCWNILMRFVILQMAVFLADRVHRSDDFFEELTAPSPRKANFRRHWAIFAFSFLWFAAIALGDIWTGPRVSFLPLYLFPAILITLFLNLGWGAFTALLGAFVASVDEYESHYDLSVIKVFAWNFPMRFLMLFVVILLLNRLRHGNVLFSSRGASRDAASNHEP